ncbi:hypothetical protein KUCAC02_033105 [Chaenocephalus aceratus]|nr:hypothetical protein KUCAC02_033105 [Chaenocephalus aceratus]
MAVMVHLVAKSIQGESGTVLAVCNNVKTVYDTVCQEESEFLPIAAIVGGMFGLNVELNASGWTYEIVNRHYGGKWAPGSARYSGGRWYVIRQGDWATVRIPRETGNVDCYHTGTLSAYMRLNDLKVDTVPSDNHCGFHAVAALLGTRDRVGLECHEGVRRELVRKTATYMMDRKGSQVEIRVYLELNSIDGVGALEDLLMEHNRWLSTEELTFMLSAHGKRAEVIAEHSYPIYTSECTYVLLKDNHYEPVSRV